MKTKTICSWLDVYFLLLLSFNVTILSCSSFSLLGRIVGRRTTSPTTTRTARTTRWWLSSSAFHSSVPTTTRHDYHEEPSPSPTTPPPPLTSVLLQISYDGRGFSGWSAGNFPIHDTTQNTRHNTTFSTRSAQRRRRRHQLHVYNDTAAATDSSSTTSVRSVQGVLQKALAKLYGNVAVDRIVVEGASRTDKGVSAVGMVAHVYGLQQPDNDNNTTSNHISTIPGKRLPHPHHGSDKNGFLPLPMPAQRLTLALNRMLPADVRVTAYAALPSSPPPPQEEPNVGRSVFHASQSASRKTYTFHLAVGARMDPTAARTTWFVGQQHHHDGNNNTALDWETSAVQETIKLLTARAYNFTAFCGAPRGRNDKQKFQAPDRRHVCRLYDITIVPTNTTTHDTNIAADPNHHWGDYHSYTIRITGDRFLYKMMRFLVGTLVAVAQQKIDATHVQTMLATERRPNDMPIVCAPPHGLILQKVHYDNDDLDWHVADS